MLRKLEQVESARDPSALLRAQFILQAQRKPQPTEPISHGKDTRTVSIRTFLANAAGKFAGTSRAFR